MGIPYYYYNIIRNNDGLLLDNLPECSRLFLDFNSIIHMCSAAVVAKHPHDFTWQQIFDEIAAHTRKVRGMCNPKLLYIAVDGVAPRAKIQQQRRRRYMTAYKNKLINDFKTKNNIPVSTWDSNCITPGTDFMKALDAFLKDTLATPGTCVVSGHDEVGEGEHKIFQYIKASETPPGSIDVIYGLDADLIMLSLCCKTTNLYLMRESTEFHRGSPGQRAQASHQVSKPASTPVTTFKFLTIDKLRLCVGKQLGNVALYDYIFICFLLGNDFIPNLTFLKIREEGVDILCDIYRRVHSELRETLIYEDDAGTYQVNHAVLIRFLELVSKIEDDGMKSVIENHEKIQYNPNKRFANKIDKYMYELESYPLIYRFPSLISPHSDHKWRTNYYYHLFGSFDSSVIKQSALNYIEGLLWTANYYFNQKFDTNWYYSFEYSPCASDVYKYAFTMEAQKMRELMMNLQHNKDKCIDATIQMLMVLPPQSMALIPEPCKELFTNMHIGCVQYFPAHFKFASFLKTQLWECNPILPVVDATHLMECVAKMITRMRQSSSHYQS